MCPKNRHALQLIQPGKSRIQFQQLRRNPFFQGGIVDGQNDSIGLDEFLSQFHAHGARAVEAVMLINRSSVENGDAHGLEEIQVACFQLGVAGIPVARIKILIFVMQGIAAALAGIVLASRMTSGQPKSSDGLELQVISACVLGGVSLTGGIGRRAPARAIRRIGGSGFG